MVCGNFVYLGIGNILLQVAHIFTQPFVVWVHRFDVVVYIFGFQHFTVLEVNPHHLT